DHARGAQARATRGRGGAAGRGRAPRARDRAGIPEMKLAAIADQPRAVEQLSRALAGDRVAHAYAFVGPTGSGRFTTACAFASELLRVDASRPHPDLHVVTPTPPESNPKGARAIRIGAIRELERRASLRPALASRRVLILDEADRMTGDAPQAFLKFLEEPPPATVVILVLTGVRAVPATVISRCQIVRFRPRQAGVADAELTAEAAQWIEDARAQGTAALFKRSERVDREHAEALIDGCWLLCRDLVLARAGAPAAVLTDPARADALAAEAARWSDDTALYRPIEARREARRARARAHDESRRRRDADRAAPRDRLLQQRGAGGLPRPRARSRARVSRAHRDAPDRRPRHHARARRDRAVRPAVVLLLAPAQVRADLREDGEGAGHAADR